MSKSWSLNVTLPQIVAEESRIPVNTAKNIVNLFEEGNEIAYIARYRGDVHGGLSCDALRKTFEVYQETKELNKKVEKALTTVETKIENRQEQLFAIQRLQEARDIKDVLDITQALTSKRKTKADHARELGLGEAAESILKGERVNINRLLDNKNTELNTREKVEKNLIFCLSDLINRLPETLDFAKEVTSLKSKVRLSARCDLSAKAKKWTEKDKEFRLIKHFETYIDFKKDVNTVQGYQVLAMDRGEEKDVLVWKIEILSDLKYNHPAKRIRVAGDHVNLFLQAFDDSITRLFIPKIQRSVKRSLKSNAETEAISCFSANLGQLFSQEGLVGCYVIALDPGFAACKSAFLTDTGAVIETTEFHLRGAHFDQKGQKILANWVKNCRQKVVFAIGNGTASIETQKAVANMLKEQQFGNKDVRFCVVPENGASKYSITPLAEAELPKMPITQKSAVSIGRRLLNPMAEYVKIEPKHLGLGMYQHSVNEKKLSEVLDLVVRQYVSLRGVDINSASVQLLQHVCGLNKKTAEGIVTYRDKNGHFLSRSQLKDIKGLGPKSYEQAAGFLLVNITSEVKDNAEHKPKKMKLDTNPLDNTTVHPMHYDIAKKLLKRMKIPLEAVGSLSEIQKRSLESANKLSPDEILIIKLLITPPKTIPPPPLLTDVRSAASLKIGETLWGRVENQVAFGVFVDIGADCKALAHKSTLQSIPYPEVGTQFLVKVISVEADRNRIGIAPVSVSSFPFS